MREAPPQGSSECDAISWGKVAWGPVAWGKVILLGEHAVVYGHKAIAGAIHRGVRCRCTPSPLARLRVPAWKVDVQAGDEHPVARAFEAMLSAAESGPVEIDTEACLPAAAGLGSSAALCVAIARALRPELADPKLQELANRGEACFHESPSGIDVALSCSGGIGVYRKSSGLTALQCPTLPLVVGLSGVARSTADMVAGVRERLHAAPDLHGGAQGGIQGSMQAIADQAEGGHEALLAGNLQRLGELMNQNHKSLQELGVSVGALDRMVHAARAAGALGAKLTGAGGGGAMIALAPGRQEAVHQELQTLGYQSFITTLGASA